MVMRRIIDRASFCVAAREYQGMLEENLESSNARENQAFLMESLLKRSAYERQPAEKKNHQ